MLGRPESSPQFFCQVATAISALRPARKFPSTGNETFTGLKVPSNPCFHRSRRQEKSGSVSGVTSDPTLAACCDLALSGDIQAAWSAPILSKDGKILGALVLFYPTPHSPGELDLELMEQTINIASIAIECHRNEEELREFSRRLNQSQDEERRRMARELHDSTGQKLAVLAMNGNGTKVKATIPSSHFRTISLDAAAVGAC